MHKTNENESNSMIHLWNILKKDARLNELVSEIENAIACFKDDERNTDLRNNVIFRQFADKLLTEEERAHYYSLPEGCRMRENAKILYLENLKCGEFVNINEGAILDASGGLEIGSHTSIGNGVYVWTHTTYQANLAMANHIKSPLNTRAPVKIGNGCFIAGPSVINPGVTLGDRTVVLPMSYVSKSFKGNCIISGNPATILWEID
ncbi:MAG: acyltransferase [Defluviitaleaceae bacterium]|nr:acyltransferase [Defluviitaleaceae bacterium]